MGVPRGPAVAVALAAIGSGPLDSPGPVADSAPNPRSSAAVSVAEQWPNTRGDSSGISGYTDPPELRAAVTYPRERVRGNTV